MKFFDPNCKHGLWFKEWNNPTWYCRYCLKEYEEKKELEK